MKDAEHWVRINHIDISRLRPQHRTIEILFRGITLEGYQGLICLQINRTALMYKVSLRWDLFREKQYRKFRGNFNTYFRKLPHTNLPEEERLACIQEAIRHNSPPFILDLDSEHTNEIFKYIGDSLIAYELFYAGGYLGGSSQSKDRQT